MEEGLTRMIGLREAHNEIDRVAAVLNIDVKPFGRSQRGSVSEYAGSEPDRGEMGAVRDMSRTAVSRISDGCSSTRFSAWGTHN
jgi:hypothetical protein